MESFELFAYFWRNYKIHLRSLEPIGLTKQRDLAPILKTELKKTKDGTLASYLNRWLREDSPQVHGEIKAAFDRQRFTKLLSKKTGIPLATLRAPTLEEFVSQLAKAGIKADVELLPPPEIWASQTRGTSTSDPLLCSEEEAALRCISEHITSFEGTIFEWIAPFQSGASFVADQLFRAESLRDEYDTVFHIYFDPCSSDGRSELRALSKHLGLDPDAPQPDAGRITALTETRCLVVLHGASYTTSSLASDNWPIKKFIRDVRQRGSYQKKAILLVISESQFATTNPTTQAAQASELLKVETAHRFKFFRSEMDRFVALRGSEGQLHDSDARLKQARWHYRQVNDVEIWPASIRLRAFFASNMANESYFDPTQGFKQLAGSIDLTTCPDILSLHREAEVYFRVLVKEFGGHEKQGPRFLTWCTTTLYWLTDEAIDYISSEASGKIQPLGKETCRKFAGRDEYTNLVRFAATDKGDTSYAMTMGVKAVIQDIWKSLDDDAQYNRAILHYYTAKRLFEVRDTLPLGLELPYVRGRADDDIFFLPEVIRHLMRACGKAVPRPGRKPQIRANDYDNHDLKKLVVEPPTRDAQGCNPEDAWRFSYWVVFRRILNGKNRQLTRRFGAYQLKLEVLQLLCGDGDFETDHPGMPLCDAPFFLNDLACALLDVGRAKEAATVFARLSKLAEDSGNYTTLCKSLINEAMVAGVMGTFDSATEFADRAAKLISNGKVHDAVCEKLGERLRSRRAHIAYLSGDLDEAIDIYQGLERPDLRPTIRRDRALPYIRSLAQRSTRGDNIDQFDLSKAIAVCISNMISSTTISNFHEVLGFEIAMAELFRRQGFREPAESCLDQVYLDILNHGCSERTYISFLIEAGEVLLTRNNAARAYAAYLDPAMSRLKTRALAYERAQAKHLALVAIEMMEQQLEGHDTPEAWQDRLAEDLGTPDFLEAAVAPDETEQDLSPMDRVHGKNPHFSFDLIGVSKWTERLENAKGLAEQRSLLNNLPWI